MTMLLAAALGRETLSAARTSGVLLSIAGVAVALGGKAAGATAAAHDWGGELAIAAAAFSGAACSVLYRPYLNRYPALPVGALAMLASVAVLTVPAAAEGLFGAPLQLATAGWAAILFIGVSSGIGYYLWLWALARAPATQVTVFLALSPITAALLGALLLGEGVGTATIAGLGCTVLGLWLAHREGLPRQTRASAAPRNAGHSRSG
jgi:drug/metabolite transporter (DMT)-like permease